MAEQFKLQSRTIGLLGNDDQRFIGNYQPNPMKTPMTMHQVYTNGNQFNRKATVTKLSNGITPLAPPLPPNGLNSSSTVTSTTTPITIQGNNKQRINTTNGFHGRQITVNINSSPTSTTLTSVSSSSSSSSSSSMYSLKKDLIESETYHEIRELNNDDLKYLNDFGKDLAFTSLDIDLIDNPDQDVFEDTEFVVKLLDCFEKRSTPATSTSANYINGEPVWNSQSVQREHAYNHQQLHQQHQQPRVQRHQAQRIVDQKMATNYHQSNQSRMNVNQTAPPPAPPQPPMMHHQQMNQNGGHHQLNNGYQYNQPMMNQQPIQQQRFNYNQNNQRFANQDWNQWSSGGGGGSGDFY